MTAVLQNHSRKEGISVDELVFDFKIMMGPDDTDEALSNVKEHIDVKEMAFKVSQRMQIVFNVLLKVCFYGF